MSAALTIPDLAGKAVLITGASTGIGAATARAAAAEGWKVALAARNLDKLEELTEELGADNAVPIQTDVTDYAAQEAMVGMQIDPRPYAVGSIAATLEAFPHIGPVLPALGYTDEQLRELEETIDAVPCDVVVNGTSIDLARLVRSRHPIRNVRCELRDLGTPTLRDVLRPLIARMLERHPAPA